MVYKTMKQRELEQILNTYLGQFEEVKIRVIALERAMERILSKNKCSNT